jgi:hypothetical protein
MAAVGDRSHTRSLFEGLESSIPDRPRSNRTDHLNSVANEPREIAIYLAGNERIKVSAEFDVKSLVSLKFLSPYLLKSIGVHQFERTLEQL